MYQVAAEVGLHPSVLSALLNGIVQVQPDDERVLRLAEFLKVPPQQAFCDEATMEMRGRR